MNIVVEKQPKCLVTLQIALPPDYVAKERSAVIGEFRKYAAVPGYRSGKAPAAAIESRYGKRIQDELGKQILEKSIKEVIKEKNLAVIGIANNPEPKFEIDGSLSYSATFIIEPEFELPDYSNVTCEATLKEVSDEDVQKTLDSILNGHATFTPVEGRPLAMADFAVLTYEATLDGKPLAEILPSVPRQLAGQKNAWLLMAEGSLLPGFCDALIGMNQNDERTFDLALPADFPIAEFAGKSLHYTALLNAIQTRQIPPLDDELAEKIMPGMNAEKFLAHIRTMLDYQAQEDLANARRRAVIEHITKDATFDVPDREVAHETDMILRRLIEENQARGISDDELKQNEKKLIEGAQFMAYRNVHQNFILDRIADKENIFPTEEDLSMELTNMAMRSGVAVQKLLDNIKKSNSLSLFRNQVRHNKTISHIAKQLEK